MHSWMQGTAYQEKFLYCNIILDLFSELSDILQDKFTVWWISHSTFASLLQILSAVYTSIL